MKTPVMLLLTNDPQLEDSIAHALVEMGGLGYLARDAREAMQTIRGVGRGLDLAMIDFEYTAHGMSLISAISMCREDLPIIVVRRDDEKYVEALAYASGAALCLTKPVTATETSTAIKQFCKLEPELAAG